jgi:SAM-dependent methyltransferase
VLDLGSGTGELLPALRAAAPGACILGVDRSDGMLRISRRSALCHLSVMDAQRLALRARSFDLALLVFVLFHVPDAAAALGEVARVLRAGGTVGLVTWGEDPGMPGTALWTEELDAHRAAPDPRDPSVMQHALMDTPEKLGGLLEAASFAVVRIWRARFEHTWTVDSLLALQLGCGMPARRLASLPTSERTACRDRVRARLARLSPGELVYRTEVLYAVAHRPA